MGEINLIWQPYLLYKSPSLLSKNEIHIETFHRVRWQSMLNSSAKMCNDVFQTSAAKSRNCLLTMNDTRTKKDFNIVVVWAYFSHSKLELI